MGKSYVSVFFEDLELSQIEKDLLIKRIRNDKFLLKLKHKIDQCNWWNQVKCENYTGLFSSSYDQL